MPAITNQLTEAHFQTCVEALNDVLFVLTADGIFSYVSPQWKDAFGYEVEETIGQPFMPFVHPDDVAACIAFLGLVVTTGTKQSGVEYRVKCKDGSFKWYSANASVAINPVDGSFSLVGVGRDVSELKALNDKLRESEEQYRVAFMTSPDAINITRLADGRYLDVNEGFTKLTGWTRAEAIGHSSVDLNIWRHMEDRQRLLDGLKKDGGYENFEAEFVTKDQRVITGLMSAHVVTIRGEQCLLTVTHDITERKSMEQQIRHLAFYDPLTNLPNRRLLDDRLGLAIATSKRTACHCALMFVDLDNFKGLNDAHGHHVGDQLLVEVAARLKGCVREMDTVARAGGDEFVVILNALDIDADASLQQAMVVAEKIRAIIAKPFALQINAENAVRTIAYSCTVSIGVTAFLDGLVSHDEILRWADNAMYKAKNNGRNCICAHCK